MIHQTGPALVEVLSYFLLYVKETILFEKFMVRIIKKMCTSCSNLKRSVKSFFFPFQSLMIFFVCDNLQEREPWQNF